MPNFPSLERRSGGRSGTLSNWPVQLHGFSSALLKPANFRNAKICRCSLDSQDPPNLSAVASPIL